MQGSAPVAPAGAVRRLLVINPNSNPDVAGQIRQVAERVLWAGSLPTWSIRPRAQYAIESGVDRAAAEPEVVALIEAGVSASYHGYVLACFNDIAVAATRGRIGAPVVCAVEASLALARSLATRPAIVTTVDAAVPGIRTLVARLGGSGFFSVRAAGIGVAAAAQLGPEAQQRLSAAIDAAITDDGADAIILGSGGLAGHASNLSRGRSIRIIDSIEAAVIFAAAAACLNCTAGSESLSAKPLKKVE
jgi:allantoin racemase